MGQSFGTGQSLNWTVVCRVLAVTVACLCALPAAALDSLKFRVQGGGRNLAETLGASSLLVESYGNGVRDPEDILAAARADYARIVAALYSQGRFGGTVSIRIDGREVAKIDPLATPTRIAAGEVVVRPGPLFRFARADVKPVAAGTELPSAFSPGAPARTPAIERAASAAVEGWRASGNAKATVGGQTIIADHAISRVDAQIAIAPGPRLRFGPLRVQGQSAVSERRIRKIAGFAEGEQFEPEEVERTTRRLRKTGTFRSVTLNEAETPNSDGTLDMILTVEDQKPRRFGFGAEIESTEGLSLSAFWLHRNLWGGAERLRFELGVLGIGAQTGGSTNYLLDIELLRPATPDARTDAFISGGIERFDEPFYKVDVLRFGFGLVREVNDHVTAKGGLEYRYSDAVDGLGTRTYSQLFFPLVGTLDKRDDILNTSDGYYLNLEVAPFIGFGDSEDGVRGLFDARGFRDFGKKSRVVLAGRLQAKSNMGVSIIGLPNDLRYTSGGSGTVRGQEYESLNLNLNGYITGGRSFLGMQSEVRTKVSEVISVVAFYDWGKISSDSVPGSSGVSQSGAGLGLRYDTGIGPIRFDVGFPVTGPNTSSGMQFYVGIGQTF